MENEIKKYKKEEKTIKKRGKQKRQQLEDEESGGGLTPITRSTSYHDSQICPDSLVRDVSRLEVLIGGRSAGNNSIEVINEAVDIAQRLFQKKNN